MHDSAVVSACDPVCADINASNGSSTSRPKLAGFEMFALDKKAEAEQMVRNGAASADSVSQSILVYP